MTSPLTMEGFMKSWGIGPMRDDEMRRELHRLLAQERANERTKCALFVKFWHGEDTIADELADRENLENRWMRDLKKQRKEEAKLERAIEQEAGNGKG